MNLIKAYHTCPVDGFNGIHQTGVIKADALLNSDRCFQLTEHFTYFRPIQPLLFAQWGDYGFTFDTEVLIREFGGCLCYDSPLILALCQEERDDFYSHVINELNQHNVTWPKPRGLYGDDALDVLRQLQTAFDSFSYTSQADRCDYEHYVLSMIELRCSAEIPISKAYGHYGPIPRNRWWQLAGDAEFKWDTTIVHNSECIHQSQWETNGYETRLNQ